MGTAGELYTCFWCFFSFLKIYAHYFFCQQNEACAQNTASTVKNLGPGRILEGQNGCNTLVKNFIVIYDFLGGGL